MRFDHIGVKCMKAWIVHDSQYGNGESLAKAMRGIIQEKMKVDVGHVKKTSPQQVAHEKPDLIIVGTAVRVFSTSFASKNWIRKLKRELRRVNHVIPLGVVYVTHAMSKETIDFLGKRFQRFLDRGIAISEVYPDWLSGKVEKPEGPLEDGIMENFIHVAQRLLENH